VPISRGRWRACERLPSVVSCLSLAAGGCPSFYRPRGEQLTCTLHYFYTCNGMVNSATEPTAVLANPAPIEASWCVLCAYRSGFEGFGVVVG
jgi:hypothetical protein